MTMTLLSTVNVGSGGAATIDFTSIPQGYTDLVLKISARSTSTNGPYTWADLQLRPNGSSASLTARALLGFDTTVASTVDTNPSGGFLNGNTTTANTFATVEAYIPNYAGSTFKSWSIDAATENNSAVAIRWIGANVWSSTAAISSITLAPIQGSFVQYSTASLYGITRGSGGATVS